MTIINSLEQLLTPEGEEPAPAIDAAELADLSARIGAVVRARGFAAYPQANNDFNLTAKAAELEGVPAETLRIGMGYGADVLLSLTVAETGTFELLDGAGQAIDPARVNQPALVQDVNDTIDRAYS